MGRLQRRCRRGQTPAARRRQCLARQQVRRVADDTRRRSRQCRDVEGATRSRRQRRLTES